MTLLIAILLGLILIALVSSNREAAAGVGKALHFALLGIVLIIGWVIFVSFSVWFFIAHPAGDIEQFVGIGLAAIVPPGLLWLNRKAAWKSYRNERKTALKNAAKLSAYILLWMVAMSVWAEAKTNFEYLNWTALFATIAITVGVLSYRSLTSSGPWTEAWVGGPAPVDPWEALSEERARIDADEEKQWDRRSRVDMSQGEAVRLNDELKQRTQAQNQELDAKYEVLKSAFDEHHQRKSRLSVATVFWAAIIFAVIGLVPITWNIGFEFAMNIEAVKGRAWLAGTLVVVAGLALVGILCTLFESGGDIKKTD